MEYTGIGVVPTFKVERTEVAVELDPGLPGLIADIEVCREPHQAAAGEFDGAGHEVRGVHLEGRPILADAIWVDDAPVG